MKSYLSVRVNYLDSDKVVFERILPDADLSMFPFSEVANTLHVLYPSSVVTFTSALPTNV